MSPPDGTNEPAASAGARRVTSLGALVAPSGSRAARVDIGTQAAATASIARPAALGARATPRVRAAVVDSAAPPALARSQLPRSARRSSRSTTVRAGAPELRPLHSGSARCQHKHPPASLRLTRRLYGVYECIDTLRCAQIKKSELSVQLCPLTYTPDCSLPV